MPRPATEARATPPAFGGRLDGLQVLRFFAAFSVLFGHALHEALSFGFAGGQSVLATVDGWNFGSGVDVFFVLSGFLMFYISAASFGTAEAQPKFLMRRIVRLVPLYWLFTAAMLVATLAFPAQLAHATLSVPHVLASFAFVPWLDSTALPHPLLGLGWTLNYEMFFYLLFSFALLLPLRQGLGALVVLFAALVAANPLIGANWVQLKFWSDPIILEFLFGVGLAVLFRRGVVLARGAAIAAVLAGAIGLAIAPLWPLAGPMLRPLTAGVPAALLVAAAASLSNGRLSRAGQLLVLGGDASYALYLSHPFSINLVVLVWQKLHLASPWLFALSAIAAAVLVSVTVHLALERPLTRWLHRLVDTPRRDRASTFGTAAAK